MSKVDSRSSESLNEFSKPGEEDGVLERHRGESDPWASDVVYICRDCGNRHEMGQKPCDSDDYFERRRKAFQDGGDE